MQAGNYSNDVCGSTSDVIGDLVQEIFQDAIIPDPDIQSFEPDLNDPIFIDHVAAVDATSSAPDQPHISVAL